MIGGHKRMDAIAGERLQGTASGSVNYLTEERVGSIYNVSFSFLDTPACHRPRESAQSSGPSISRQLELSSVLPLSSSFTWSM